MKINKLLETNPQLCTDILQKQLSKLSIVKLQSLKIETDKKVKKLDGFLQDEYGDDYDSMHLDNQDSFIYHYVKPKIDELLKSK